MTVYGYTEKQKDMILTAARSPGKWYEFTGAYRDTARSLVRRGIIEMRQSEPGRIDVRILTNRVAA